jgi:hypothetical protein
MPAVDHDEMIERADIHERERLFQRLSEKFVRADLVRQPPDGMVVREDHCRGVLRERGLDNLPWVNARLRERAAKQLFDGKQTVLAVEIEADETS